MNNHIVYAGFDGEICLYVGEGKPNRYLHLTSGVSHVYEANAYHFAGKVLEVKVFESGLSKEEAVRLESEYINKLNPAWNKRPFLLSSSDGLRRHVKGLIAKVFKRHRKAKKDSNKDKQMQVCKYLAGLLNSDGSVLVSRGQVERVVDLPAGFISRCVNQEDPYYPLFKEIFVVEKHDTNYYKITAKGWLND